MSSFEPSAENCKTYIIDASGPCEEITIDSISEPMASIVVCSSMLFRGQLDVHRWLASLRYVACLCPWLLCRYEVRRDGLIYAIPRRKEGMDREGSRGKSAEAFDGFFECEYCTNVDFRTYQSDHILDILPQNVHEKLKRPDLCFASVDGLPICCFRVTQYADEFTIGYRLNHVFFDQSAIVYFFRFVSDVYRNGGSCCSAQLADAHPIYQPKISVIAADAPHFSSAEDFHRCPPLPFSFTNEDKDLTFLPTLEIILEIDQHICDTMKQQAKFNRLSTNDFINALLMQSLRSFNRSIDYCNPTEANSNSNPNAVLRLLFAHNMRTSVGRDMNIMGDYVHLEGLLCPQIDIDNKEDSDYSLLNIALMNRSVLSTVGSAASDAFVEEVRWLRDLKAFVGQFQASNFWSDRYTALVTNWTSFDYDSIRFSEDRADRGALEVLLPKHSMLGRYAMWTCVLNKWDRDMETTKKLVMVTTTYPEMIEAVKECALRSNGLFNIAV